MKKTLTRQLVKFYSWLKSFKSRLYLRWISRQFKHFGEGSLVNNISNLSNPQCISIGSKVYIGHNSVLEAVVSHGEEQFSPEIIVGDNTSLGDYCHLGAIRFIHVGKYVLAGRFVLITDHSHGSADEMTSMVPPFNRPLVSKGGVTIGDRVWIGDKVTILSGVTIGEGSVIGANSVVTHDVPPYSVVAGSPARIVKKQ